MSEMNAPMIESRKVEPMKFVTVFAAPGMLKLKFIIKYENIINTFEINPMFSNATKPGNFYKLNLVIIDIIYVTIHQLPYHI